jgi:cytochrome oxidase Cu insertion factor (SCO1/SenC/PrrC family)
MESGSTENRTATAPLTEEQRAAVFAQTNAPIRRDGLARIGRPPIPQKFVMFVVTVFVILGLGGAVVEHYFGGVGTTGSPTSTTSTTTPPSVLNPSGPQLNAPIEAFMGLKKIATAIAPPISLRDQTGQIWQIGAQRGKVVVLTFFDQTCDDICLIEGTEIKLAQQQLGTMISKVEFVIVNSDPHHLSVSSTPRALRTTKLRGLRNVYFLTGSLTQLNAVWVHYGLSVKVGHLQRQIAHNNVVYFIDPNGKLRALAVPFANEHRSGAYTLAVADVQRFSQGIASEAVSLAK